MASFDGSSYIPPDFWNFRPLFTLQPVRETRDKQLNIWRDIILDYCEKTTTSRLVPSTFPLFSNDAIERKLSVEGISIIVDYLLSEGNAEWEDSSRRTLIIIFKPPSVIAEDIYRWAGENALIGSVSTIYELHSGEDKKTGCHGLDPLLVRKALVVLENGGKCKVIPGATSEEDGVKFLAP